MEEKIGFEGLGLGKEILRALQDMGFEEPSPIQARTIPLVMEGRDVIGQAQTGTGKTAAFGMPILERIDYSKPVVQALVVAPTRELSVQVAEEITRIGKYKRVKTLPVYGGQSIERQISAIRRGAHVITGTPGRLLDHIRRKTLRLDQISVVVLDEADEMLDMGFIEDIEAILSETPSERQTLLFSATMPAPIVKLAQRYMKDPVHAVVNVHEMTVPLIEQVYYEVKERDRIDALSRVLDTEENVRGIIFCRTKRGVDELTEALRSRGYQADAIHGDLNQAQRNRVMKDFRAGQVELLVATDVAARGLDIENLTHVINYDIPQDPEAYVHRIGRTGRAGRTGKAITLIHPKDFKQLKLIERLTRSRIRREELPTRADVAEKQRDMWKVRLAKLVSEGNFAEYREVVLEMVDEYDSVDLAGAALKLAIEGDRAMENRPVGQAFGETGAESGMVRFFIDIGRRHNIRPADVVRTIAERARISGGVIGVIDIYDTFTFVEVPENVAAEVFEAMRDSTIKGKSVSIEPARPR